MIEPRLVNGGLRPKQRTKLYELQASGERNMQASQGVGYHHRKKTYIIYIYIHYTYPMSNLKVETVTM